MPIPAAKPQLSTIGRILFNEAVPQAHRAGLDESQGINSGSIKNVLQHVAENDPSKYRDISHALLKLGSRSAVETESSLTLDDLRSPIDKGKFLADVEKQERSIFARKDLDEKGRNRELVKLYGGLSSSMPDTIFNAAAAKGSNLARMVASGARGTKGNMNSNVGADWLVLDHNDDPVPVPIKHSYAEGLDPAEYYAASFGTRSGLVATKFCLSGDTEVRMADFSVKKIRDIVVGDMVLGSNLKAETFPVLVTKVFNNGHRQVHRFTYRKLSSRNEFAVLDCTEEHKVLAKTRMWSKRKHEAISEPTLLPAGKKGCNEFIAVPARNFLGDGIHEHRALALGLLIGDGCLSKTMGGRISFSCADPILLDDIREYFAGFNYKLVLQGQGQYSYHFTYIKKIPMLREGRRWTGSGCPFKAWLKEIGISGKLAHEKVIPEEVWTWSNESIAQLLAGLYVTDGSVVTRRSPEGSVGCTISFASTSQKMVQQVKELMAVRLGIYCTKIDEGKMSEGRNHPMWNIRISHRMSVQRFFDQIPLIGKKKTTLARVMAVIGPLCIHNSDYTFKRVSRELIGELPTFDIEVDHPDHLFVLANGLIVSNSTQNSGFAAKQLSTAAMDLIITKPDCETTRGIPVIVDDRENIGSLLARDVGGFEAGTPITARTIKALKDDGVKNIVVRSPITCQAHAGLCSKCAGIRERGILAPVMDHVGLSAASAISEPLSQSILRQKHTAGVAGSQKSTKATGFNAINALLQSPEVFPGGAPVSNEDGVVTKIEKAPQGGSNVFINDVKYYAPPDQQLLVKPGSTLEAGDALTDGIVSPADVTRHRGIGAGRMHMMNSLRQTFLDGGMPDNRRNLEILSRAMIGHSKINGDDGEDFMGYLPDEDVEHHLLERDYKPEPDSKPLHPSKAHGQYLQKPVLYHSIGTRITPSVAKELEDNDELEIQVSPTKPKFSSNYVRLIEQGSHKTDLGDQLSSSYVARSLKDSVMSGKAVGDLHGLSPLFPLAYGLEFGQKSKSDSSRIGY